MSIFCSVRTSWEFAPTAEFGFGLSGICCCSSWCCCCCCCFGDIWCFLFALIDAGAVESHDKLILLLLSWYAICELIICTLLVWAFLRTKVKSFENISIKINFWMWIYYQLTALLSQYSLSSARKQTQNSRFRECGGRVNLNEKVS